MKCPCHSGKMYEECCAPYHLGQATPPTPLALMRSRYCAYARGNIQYIIETTHPDHPDTKLPIFIRKKQLKAFSQNTCFLGLDILETGDTTVTFRAHLKQQGHDASYTEKSSFSLLNGRWYYREALEISS